MIEGTAKNGGIRLSIIVLICMVFARGLFLEYSDLSDPTEARYATIAQMMVSSGDWLTPTLPTADGIVPYLGKPPLHFWLTAFFYKVFQVDEWTARLPSFLAALVILFFTIRFSRNNFGKETGILSGLILFSSCMFFFLAGASVTDMTLTACVTASVVALYRQVSEQSSGRWAWITPPIAAGLAFLCKGPVALVLIMLPFLLWSGVRKDFKWIRRVPWLSMGLLFLAVVLPWFIAAQLRNPEFLKYFIWNENIARYLFRDYGDRYGAGHVHMYGTSWLMLAGALAPWSILLLAGTAKFGVKKSWQWLQADSSRLFVFCWGISAALFFTFVRQLHAMYLLPALPGFSVLTAVACNGLILSAPSMRLVLIRTRKALAGVFIAASIGVLIVGAKLAFSMPAIFIGLTSLALGIVIINLIKEIFQPIQAVTLFSSLIVSLCVTAISCIAPYVDQRQSAGGMMREISRLQVHDVGVLTRNSYSHYWTSKAWESELDNKVNVEYLSEADLPNFKYRYLLAKNKSAALSSKAVQDLDVIVEMGGWVLYRRKLA